MRNSLLTRPQAFARPLLGLSLLLALCALATPEAALAAPLPGVQRNEGDLPPRAYAPLMQAYGMAAAYACPTQSSARFETIPVMPPPTDRPAAQHADLNLGLRGWEPANAYPGLVDYSGATDANAPQLTGLIAGRVPVVSSAARVYDWNWGCNCRGSLLTHWDATLLGLRTTAGEQIRIPTRGPDIYQGAYQALVLYAEEQRITLKYTREDNVIRGYTVHLEDVCVDPNLLALYRSANAGGRGVLPALRNGQVLGTAAGAQMRVAVRDTGNFMDPRSRKDWWKTVAAGFPIAQIPAGTSLAR